MTTGRLPATILKTHLTSVEVTFTVTICSLPTGKFVGEEAGAMPILLLCHFPSLGELIHWGERRRLV